MKLKLFVAMSLFAAIPIVAQAQQKGPAAPKPSTADVQKLVKSIGADPAKVKIYCDVGKLQDQMDQAEQKRTPKLSRPLAPKPTISGNNSAPIMSGSWPASNRSIRIPRKENAMARRFSRCSNSANSAANLK